MIKLCENIYNCRQNQKVAAVAQQIFQSVSESHARQQRSCLVLLHPQLADAYGSVFCIRLGRHKTVFVSGWKMVKEAIVTQADCFVDRPYSPMVTRIYSGNSGESPKHAERHCWATHHACVWPFLRVSAGLFFSNGHVWRRQRRFAMATLRSFGLAKGSTEQSICEESRHLQEAMARHRGWCRCTCTQTHVCLTDVLYSGEPFDPVPLLNNAVANIICQIVFGRRFDYTDHIFQSMLHHLMEMAYLEGSIWALVG